MRVVAGKYKRTPLLTLEGNDITRPTKDMVKEALFSSIYIDENTVFLDLFSGSGSIGIEALSRGAKDVIFNDLNIEAVKIIKQNLIKLKENRCVHNYNYDLLLNRVNTKFDYIYVDPPYAFKYYDHIFELISKNNLLNDDGYIIVEIRKDVILLDKYNEFELLKERKYGITKLRYYRKAKND